MPNDNNNIQPPKVTLPDDTLPPMVTPPDTNSSSVIGVVAEPAKKYAGGRIIATILGLFLLVGGVGAGIFLVGQNQNPQEKAWDACNDWNPPNCPEGDQTTTYCQGQCIHHGCKWVDGKCKSDLDDGGIIKCNEPISAYNRNWQKLSSDWLTKLKEGSEIKLAIPTTIIHNTGRGPITLELEAARFTVNGHEYPVTTQKSPDNKYYYMDYVIPQGVKNFIIKAKVKWITGWLDENGLITK